MVKYEVRIDGSEFDRSLTLDELLENGFLDDYDPSIQVRAKGEARWITARDYPFAEKEKNSTSGYTINEDGSITRQSKKSKKPTSSTSGYRVNEDGSVTRRSASSSSSNSSYHVNEDGTVTRRNAPRNSSSTSSTSSSSSSSTSSSSSSSSNSGCMEEIWQWIIVIAIAIPLALIFFT